MTGIGLRETYTLLYPEEIIFDNDLCKQARYALMELEVNPETIAVDVIGSVGPGGHYLNQKHTRKHMPHDLMQSLAHHLDDSGEYHNPMEVAREKVAWILENHEPEPLDEAIQREIIQLLDSAGTRISIRNSFVNFIIEAN